MKRVPSFSGRPGFPSGLQVLLVEADTQSREKVSKQLQQLTYVGTACSSTLEAAEILSARPDKFDIVLAEAKTVAQESPAFVNALDGMPLVLMSEGGSANIVWKSIELGAVEYLEKPLSELKLRNIWQHVVRKMMQGNEQEDSSCKPPQKDSGASPALLHNQKSFSQPDSPSTPSALSSGVDPDFTLDESLRGFKLGEGGSSSSLSDPSDLFLPELSSDTSASQPSTISTAQLSSGSTPVPAAKKLRRSNTKDSSTATTGTASVTHRPPLAIRPAPSGFSMMQQPMLGGMGGGQWGYQHLPGYVWGTPMANSPMPLDRSCSWQTLPHQSSFCGELQRHHSMPVQCSPLSSVFSQGSRTSSGMGFDPAVSVDLGLEEPFLDTLGSFSLDGVFDPQAAREPPIGLQLKKSESFLDLINEHLRQADSAAMVS
ncbi:hypothetical protein ABBQ32_004216 [Trebouxia sp. C0010 RCD-2024]